MRLIALLLAQLVTGATLVHAQDVTPESRIFRSAHQSVFRVEAGLAHGTGFLVSDQGLIATNDHVISSSPQTVSVYLDSVTRVRATIVARDEDADIAILKVSPSRCRPCVPLVIAKAFSLQPGDRIVALGFPLGQPLTLTSGLIGNVQDGVIVTEMTLNPGNSGGPIFGLSGEVVAMSAFRDTDPGGVGSGLSGGITLGRLHTLITGITSPEVSPPDSLLPVVPWRPFPVALVRDVADTTAADYYNQLAGISTGPFDITLTSPLSRMVGALALGREVGSDRARREARSDVPNEQRYAASERVRFWEEFVGDPALPVFAVRIAPRVSETIGSRLGRAFVAAMVGMDATATIRFDGDVQGARFTRDGNILQPLRGGHAPQRILIDNEWVSLKDVADFGYYLLPPAAFAPRPDNTLPDIVIEIDDLKSRKTYRERLDPYVVARMWNDYAGLSSVGHQGPPLHLFRLAKQCVTSTGASALGVAKSPNDDIGGECSYTVLHP